MKIFAQRQDEEPETANTEPAQPEPADLSPDPAFAALNAEVTRLETESGELRDQLLRRQAEFDNFRKRMERERGEYRAGATMDAVNAILPVLDGLEQALKVQTTGGAEIRKGVELVEKQLREILEKMGLSRIDAQGKPFDPHLHHAVEMVHTTEHEDHTVLEVYQAGYMFQDKLLRPAMVRVAVHE